MDTKNYEKPLNARFKIEGVSNEVELYAAGKMLLQVYNLACDIVNNGGIERFNSEWDRLHTDASSDEYDLAYCRYFKAVADEVVNLFAKAYCYNTVYRLKECHPCTLNFERGYFTIYGYKETQNES